MLPELYIVSLHHPPDGAVSLNLTEYHDFHVKKSRFAMMIRYLIYAYVYEISSGKRFSIPAPLAEIFICIKLDRE